MSCWPATFVVGRGRCVGAVVGAMVGTGVGDSVGDGLGDGVSGATVGTADGEGLGSATGAGSRPMSAIPAPTASTSATATPPASFVRNGTLIG